MLRSLFAFSLAALCAIWGVLRDNSSLQSSIGNDDIEVYFPGQPGYQNASRAFNLRLNFEPIAVAYPNSTEEVAELVKIGASLGIPGEMECIHMTSKDRSTGRYVSHQSTLARAATPTLATASVARTAT